MRPKKQPSSRFSKNASSTRNPNGRNDRSTMSMSSNKCNKSLPVPKYDSALDRRRAFCISTGLCIEDTPRDGSCQYHSVLQGLRRLGRPNLPTARDLRLMVATIVEQNVTNNDVFYTGQMMSIFSDNRDGLEFHKFLDDYLLGIRTNQFGDELTLNAIADVLQVNIRVYHPNLMNDVVPDNMHYGNPHGRSGESRDTVSILLLQEHYETLYRLNTVEPPRPSLELNFPSGSPSSCSAKGDNLDNGRDRLGSSVRNIGLKN